MPRWRGQARDARLRRRTVCQHGPAQWRRAAAGFTRPRRQLVEDQRPKGQQAMHSDSGWGGDARMIEATTAARQFPVLELLPALIEDDDDLVDNGKLTKEVIDLTPRRRHWHLSPLREWRKLLRRRGCTDMSRVEVDRHALVGGKPMSMQEIGLVVCGDRLIKNLLRRWMKERPLKVGGQFLCTDFAAFFCWSSSELLFLNFDLTLVVYRSSATTSR
jgi:hypothetical protein